MSGEGGILNHSESILNHFEYILKHSEYTRKDLRASSQYATPPVLLVSATIHLHIARSSLLQGVYSRRT